MKKTLLLLLFLTPLVTAAQRTFKFNIVDDETGKPLTDRWGTILKNNEEYADGIHSNSAGECSFTLRDYDSTATYQVEFVNRWNNYMQPGVYELKGIKNTDPVIRIKKLATVMPFACGEVMYSGYHPRVPTSIHDLPKEIQARVEAYLVNRVGREFYNRLILNGGQIIDLKRFHEIDTYYKADPPAYSLCFMVYDSIHNANLYDFNLKLDSNGKLIGNLLLPDIRHNPFKAKFLTLDEAKEIAIKNNFYNEYTSTNTSYYPEDDCVVREFSQLNREPNKSENDMIETRLLINIHSGAIVSKVSRQVYVNHN